MDRIEIESVRLGCPDFADVFVGGEALEGLEPFLLRKAGQSFYNTSPLDMRRLMGDQDHIRENLCSYIAAFSPAVRDIFERFEFHAQVDRLAKAGLLYQVAEKFAAIGLHPDAVDNHQMGLVFEELIRKFAELSNETAGEHFTPREVIRLMVNLLFIEDDEVLSKPGVVRTVYDPTAGTGGMLSTAGEYLTEHNPQARLTMFGQELNPESYAICKADMLIKGQDVANIVFGNTLSDDGHPHRTFDYMLSNPPFGVEWKKVEKEVRKEHETQGLNGRFGPGLGDDPNGGYKPMLYIGETDAVDERLRSHNQKKAFWERVCIVTSKDHNLTKAHAKYLESRLIAIAAEAGRVVFDNGTSPEYALPPESDIADMEFFIEQVRIVLPVLGLDFLRERPKLAATAAQAPTSDEAAALESPLFELVSKRHGVHAEAREVEGEFIILAGSVARGDGSESWNSYRAQREELKQDGTLVPQNGNYVFSKNASFRSPSAASAALLDRNDNGRTSWCIKGTRKTYADWQEEQVAVATPEGSEE